jgi:hypothetical protein
LGILKPFAPGFAEGLLKLEGEAGRAVGWEVTKLILSKVAG